MTPIRILVVEDELDVWGAEDVILRSAGFETVHAADGFAALEILAREPVNLVVLDIRLPGMSGLEVLRRIRDEARTRPLPVLIVSALGEESDVVDGLGLGSDDYLCKPFQARVLVARVRSLLRRAAESAPDSGRRHRVELEPATHAIKLDGRPVVLTPSEYKLLQCLMDQPGHVVAREDLLERIGHGRHGRGTRNVDVHVRSLRRKLGENCFLIGTARGGGYYFITGRNGTPVHPTAAPRSEPETP